MLKITIVDASDEQKLILEGRLTEPWLSELKSCWESARKAHGGRNCVVDLNGVTYIDRNGEDALLEMRNEGAQLVARGICNKHKLADIENRSKTNFGKGSLEIKETR
jgi:anti-anti-sigma regulatory factor